MGQVFGAAIDSAGAIYTTATTVYGDFRTTCGTGSQPAGAFGPSGPGAVYRTNPITGAVSPFTILPNTGAGLGNVAYDPTNNQLFVTNFADGQIYRIKINNGVGGTASAGTFQSWAPFGAVTVLPNGFAPLGQRPWGIGVFGNQVYYSNWTADAVVNGTNSIYSVPLTAGALPLSSGPAGSTKEFDLTTPTDPVSDIKFSSDGLRMLVAKRTMSGDIRCPVMPGSSAWAHQSDVIEYARSTVSSHTWSPNPRLDIGQFLPHNNSAGGADYGYHDYSAVLSAPVGCEQTIWATGDYLLSESIPPSIIYGLEGIDITMNTGLPLNVNYYYDFDSPFAYNQPTYEKSMPGDVVIWRDPCGSCYIEVCKASSATKPVPPGFVAHFVVPGSNFSSPTNPLTVPVGQCSGPTKVTCAATALITELPFPGVSVSNVTAVGFSPPPLSAFEPDLLEDFDPTTGAANVFLNMPGAPGNASSQTLVTFTNQEAPPAVLKICKIAGPGVIPGTTFPFTITSLPAGSIIQVNISNAGSGYTSAPLVTFTGGGCTTEPAAIAVVSGGSVSLQLTSQGAGCSSPPTVIIGPPSTGTGVTATATAVTSITLTNVQAGPAPEGGYCQVVSGTFPVATAITIQETLPNGYSAPTVTVNGKNIASGPCTPPVTNKVCAPATIGAGINEVSFTNCTGVNCAVSEAGQPITSPALGIVNYSFVSQRPGPASLSYVTYKADLLNVGAAPVGPIMARLTSRDALNFQVVGQGALKFEPAEANTQVTSTNTFTVLTDPAIPFDFLKLEWTIFSRRSVPVTIRRR